MLYEENSEIDLFLDIDESEDENKIRIEVNESSIYLNVSDEILLCGKFL